MQVENGSAKAAGNLFDLASARDSHGGEWTKRALKQSVASVRMAAFERMTERPYMDSSSLQASFALAPVPTAHVYSASDFGIDSMQGLDGLFARRLPIASTCFVHLDT